MGLSLPTSRSRADLSHLSRAGAERYHLLSAESRSSSVTEEQGLEMWPFVRQVQAVPDAGLRVRPLKDQPSGDCHRIMLVFFSCSGRR